MGRETAASNPATDRAISEQPKLAEIRHFDTRCCAPVSGHYGGLSSFAESNTAASMALTWVTS